MEMHWYAVQVFSSMEKSVKAALEERIYIQVMCWCKWR